jgi:hypothetical protein
VTAPPAVYYPSPRRVGVAPPRHPVNAPPPYAAAPPTTGAWIGAAVPPPIVVLPPPVVVVAAAPPPVIFVPPAFGLVIGPPTLAFATIGPFWREDGFVAAGFASFHDGAFVGFGHRGFGFGAGVHPRPTARFAWGPAWGRGWGGGRGWAGERGWGGWGGERGWREARHVQGFGGGSRGAGRGRN